VPALTYLRWQAPVVNRRGFFPGIFALVNGLAHDGELTAEEERFRTTTNAWFHANLTDPAVASPGVYDRERHPGAAAWFKPTAHDCLARVPGYLSILAAHGVPCVLVRTTEPGLILYDDDCQVIAMPTPAAL
jgi:hypothetical protein